MTEAFAQRLALEQFGDDVGRAILLADGVDGKNVGVVERGGGFGLKLEAAQSIGIS